MNDERYSSHGVNHPTAGLIPDTLRTGLCSSKCVFFKCGRKSLQNRGQTIWCTWISDTCSGSSCSYAQCFRGKMLPQNKCGLMIRRITRDIYKPEDFEVNIKIPGKLAKRLGNDTELV